MKNIVHIYIIESPCYTAEINTTLQINYTSIKFFLKSILVQAKNYVIISYYYKPSSSAWS